MTPSNDDTIHHNLFYYFTKSIPDFLERTTGALPENEKGDDN
jgi:hypothetical protein